MNYEIITAEEILALLELRQYKELKDVLEEMHPVDLAEMMEDFEDKQIILVF